MSETYVLLGLARTRKVWFSEISRWATSGAAPIDFVKCLTAEEARAVMGAGRLLSALVADGTTPGVDRELISAAAVAGIPTIVVSDGRTRRDWDSLGCAAVLPDDFTAAQLVGVLAQHARPVERSLRRAATVEIDAEPPRSRLVGVTGAGGSGSSTIAMAIAQSMAHGRPPGSVALVDGCRAADLAMYHDVGDVIPGLPELVEAHRVDHPDPEDIRSLLFRIPRRNYDLLLGLRGPRDWVAMRPNTLRAAIDGLQRSYDVVVVDHDPDLEGEAATGSVGVEDRHGLARAVVERSEVVVAVGVVGLKGTNDLVRLIASLHDEGVPSERILPVVTRARRSPAVRAETTRTLARLTASEGGPGAQPPVFVGHLRALEAAQRSATALPESVCGRPGRAVQRLLLSLDARPRPGVGGSLIRRGELGTDSDAFDEVLGSPGRRSDAA